MLAFTRKSYTATLALGVAALAFGLMPLHAQILAAPSSGPTANTTPGTAPGHTKIRATAVIEFAGEKPASGAYRLVPIAIYENGRFRDAQIFEAAPVPFALQQGAIYEVQDAGKPIGYATVNRTGEAHLSESGDRQWYGIGYLDQTAPDAEIAKAPSKIVLNDTNEQHRVYMPDDKKKRGRRGRNQDPSSGNKPDTKKPSDSDSTSDSKPPVTDADRPTLKKRSAEDKSAAATPPPELPPNSVEEDPNRPRLSRGKPQGGKPLPEDVEFKQPDLHVLAAVSDPTNKDAHPYRFAFNGQEEQEYRAKLLALAAAEIKRARPDMARIAPASWQEITVRAFSLSLDNSATLVMTATVPSTPQPSYVAVVARVGLDGELRRTFFQLTDRSRFDIAPRMQLVDAVDADGDGRGELLFRLDSDSGTGWGIYRATPDDVRKLFDTLPPAD